MSTKKPLHKASPGQGLVEFALILPILLFITLGMIDFGRVLFTYAMASNSVRDALRQAAIFGYVGGGGTIPAYRDCEHLRNTASQVFFMTTENITVSYIDGTDLNNRTLCTTPDYPDAAIETGDILEVAFYTEISLLTPGVSRITPVMPIQITGHRTIVKNIDFHGATDLSDPDRDIDFDGLPDLWEDQHFGMPADGNVTAAELAAADANGDPDNDGCRNGCEVTHGSDPHNPDTDGDGLLDGEEAFQHITDPTKDDTDGDCITDDVEVDPATFTAFGVPPTNPRIADADGDGLLDGEELKFCDIDLDDDGVRETSIPDPINPHDTDTDDDSLSDWEEVNGMTDGGIAIGCQSNPAAKDTDADLTPDNYEVIIGRNPCDPETTEVYISDGNLTVSENAGMVVFTVVEMYPIFNPDLPPQTVTVNYATSDGPGVAAVAGADYSAASGTLTFNASSTPVMSQSRTISVSILEDDIDEPDEAFTLTLSGAVEANLGSPSSSIVTIGDNDDVPTINILTPVTEAENASPLMFEVTLSHPSAYTIIVSYAANTAGGDTATADVDYNQSGGDVTFAPGELSHTVSVLLLDDSLDEPNETFTIRLNSLPATVNPGLTEVTATIEDDDGPPTVSLSGITSISETNGVAQIEVNVLPASSYLVTVPYEIIDGTAFAGTDYSVSSTTGTLSFAPGETTKLITLTALHDTLDEADETVLIRLGTPSNAQLTTPSEVTVVISDDDSPPAISMQTNYSISEGSGSLVVEVTLSGISGQPVSVDYATSDGSATAGVDYVAASGTLTFAPNDTSETITIQISPDLLDEIDESFTLTLSNPVNTVLNTISANIIITDDDSPPSVSIESGASVIEGNPPDTTTLSFKVTLSAVSGQAITVGYTIGGGSANNGADYNGSGGTLTFAPNDLEETITVTVIGDLTDEPDETFNVTLTSTSSTATLGANVTAIGTIQDDDPIPVVSIQGVDTVNEGSGTDTTVQYKITLDTASHQPVTIAYWLEVDAVMLTSAIAPADYVALNDSVTFAPGEREKWITVTIIADTVDEGDEVITLHAADNDGVRHAVKTITIIDDDPTI